MSRSTKRSTKGSFAVVRSLPRLLALPAAAATLFAPMHAMAASSCNLHTPAGNIQHVIYFQFDNTHFNRDNPNVPSDLEQMPHLLSFMEDNGTLLTNDHTVLIAHTGGGMMSTMTGVYPDREGQTVSNSYVRTSTTGAFTFPSSFSYWTDSVSSAGTPTVPNIVTPTGTNAPAPWVPFTRAGCDYGAVANTNTVLENVNAGAFAAGPSDFYAASKVGDTKIDLYSYTGMKVGDTLTIDQGANQETATIASFSGYYAYLTAPLTKAHAKGVEAWVPAADPVDHNGDITTIFGANSPEWQEAFNSQTAPYGSAAARLATTDFVGLGVHCAQGSAICASGVSDVLPAEPNGYTGFKALFGAKELNPVLVGGPVVNDILGNPITDSFGQPGFPNFDGMEPAVSLGYVAAMQEKGIPVTFAYLSDAHDNHGVDGNTHNAYGPGDAGYVAQLQAYDQAFAAFFDRLAADGINKSNTLFVFTVDEGDHYVGVNKTDCDGVTVPCVYGTNEVGEVNANIDTLVSQQFPSIGAQFLDSTGAYTFTVHGDDAPTFYLASKTSGMLPQTNPTTRDFERDMAALTMVNPYTGNTDHPMVNLADQAGMKAAHMFTSGDPARNPTFVMFADPTYYITDYPTSTCLTCIQSGYAWNHGDIQPEIANTWIGYVGPGVKNLGQTASYWTDHTDMRPTVLALLGLSDDYVSDGRVVTQAVVPKALPASLRTNGSTVVRLGTIYKKINAPYGQFSLDMVTASTHALNSGSDSDDSTYTSIEGKITTLTSRRDTLAAQMKTLLDGAEFKGLPISSAQANPLISQASKLLSAADSLAAQ